MGKISRDKGAEYERRWARCLRENGFGAAERGRDNGFRSGSRSASDRYDTQGVIGVLFDVKAGYDTISPEQEERWLVKVETDARQRGQLGVLIRSRRGQGDERNWWAFVSARTLLELHLATDPAAAALFLDPSRFERLWRPHPAIDPILSVRLRAGELILLLRAAGYGDPLPDGEPLPPAWYSGVR